MIEITGKPWSWDEGVWIRGWQTSVRTV